MEQGQSYTYSFKARNNAAAHKVYNLADVSASI